MQEGGHFTIDFIEEQYRESVNMIMQILCVDLKTAYDLFISSGCNVQAAIHSHTNPEPQQYIEPEYSITQPSRNRRNGAIRSYRNELQQFQNHQDEQQDEDQYQSFPVARRRPVPQRVQEQSQFDVKFNRFLEFKRKKKSFAKNYKIRRETSNDETVSIGMKIFERKPKRPQSKKLLELKPYINQLQDEFLSKRSLIKFGQGSMSESLQQSFQKHKPLLIFHLNFDKNELKSENMKKSSPKIKKKKMVIDLQEDQPVQKVQEIEEKQKDNKFKSTKKNSLFKALLLETKTLRIVNDAFENYIVDSENYNYENYFRDYFEQKDRKQSFLLILRVNILEQIELVGRVNLQEIISTIDQKQENFGNHVKKIIEQLRRYYDKTKSIEKQQTQLAERYRLLQMGIDHFEYEKPPSTAEKIKIKEDREIIRQQEEEFLSLQNGLLEQQIKEVEKESAEMGAKISKEELLKNRQAIRDKLTKYESGSDIMMIKFRLPNAKNIILNVSIKESVSYLYDYISSLQIQDIGFEEEEDGGHCERNFDIIRAEDRMNLSQKMDKSLEEVFEGSLMESLNVKEK